jgi:hypothetical protein
MAVVSPERPTTPPPAPPEQPPRRDRSVPWGLITLALVAIAVFSGVNWVRDLIPDFQNPFAERTIDRSGPAVLKSIEDLGLFVGASGTFQQLVDLEKDTGLPSELLGSRTLFVAVGTAEAAVDLRALDADAVTVSEDGTAVTVRLPSPDIRPAELDVEQSYVYDREEGVFTEIGGLFGGGDANDLQEVYTVARDRIDEAAQNAGLRVRAAQNLRQVLAGMLRPLGYERITVTYTG